MVRRCRAGTHVVGVALCIVLNQIIARETAHLAVFLAADLVGVLVLVALP